MDPREDRPRTESAEPTGPNEPEDPPAAPKLARPVAMIVDDARTVREVLRSILAPDHDCVVFSDVPSALEAARANPPDIIISDVVMEPVDGHEFCRQVRAEPLLREIPFVLLTSQTDPDGRAAGLEDGADDYLSKPVRARELLARAGSLLRLRAAKLEIVRQKIAIASSHNELLLAQRQLLASEKLATLGTISAGVAHEINNPLGFVLSGVNQLSSTAAELAELAPDEVVERRELLVDISEIRSDILVGIDRIRAVIENLRLLSLDFDLPPVSLDVSSEVERSLAISASKLSSIEVVRNLPTDLRVSVTPGYITQIVLNMIENAADAVRSCRRPRVTVSAQAVKGGVEIRVEDNGQGIAPHVLPRIFEPFFTTKPAGVGAGLGLSVCYGLARRLGGSLSAQSQPGVVTSFTLFVPSETLTANQDFCQSRSHGLQAPRRSASGALLR